MKILYVTTAWTGLNDVLFNGVEEPRGMPAFIKPLKRLIERGHEVKFLLIHNFEKLPEYKINVNWLRKEQIIGDIRWELSLIKKPISAIKLYAMTFKLLKENKYDFVYAHGESAEPSRIAAKKLNIPFGHRLYGTFLYDYICKNGKFKASIIHYLEYKVFSSKKDFLLITNDGSNGDKAFSLINKNKEPSKFYFLYNGIDHSEEVSENILKERFLSLGATPFLFYVARIDKWKRQEDAIMILNLINKRGYNLKLYLAGQIINKDYYEELKKLIQKLGLEDNVIYMGVINREQINMMCKLAICSFSLYDMCNLGNVFHEMLSSGAVIMSKNDGSLDNFINHKENGFLLDNIEEAPDYLEQLIRDKDYERSIRENAIKVSRNKMLSWNERVDKEIEIIEGYAKCKRW